MVFILQHATSPLLTYQCMCSTEELHKATLIFIFFLIKPADIAAVSKPAMDPAPWMHTQLNWVLQATAGSHP